MNEAEILKITDKMKLFIFMRNMTAELWDADTLQKLAFNIDGWSGFKTSDMQQKRLRYLDDVKAETKQREDRYGVRRSMHPSAQPLTYPQKDETPSDLPDPMRAADDDA